MRATRLTAVCASAVMLGLIPAAAHAASPSAAENYQGVETGTMEDCGFSVEFQDTFSGRYSVRTVEGSGGEVLLAQDSFRYRSVLTNPATGDWMVIRGNGVSRDMTATHLGGDLWEVTALYSGQPFVVEDSEGDVVVRDHGNLRTWSVVDTLGDGEPGGDIVDFGITGIHGSYVGPELDFCDLLNDIIG